MNNSSTVVAREPERSHPETGQAELHSAPMHVVFASDKCYAEHLAVALCSLCENNRKLPLSIYIVNSDLDQETWSRLESIAKRYGHGLTDVKIVDHELDALVITSYYKTAMYYRLLIAEKLPISKALYLDADVVVRGPIDELYSTNVDDYYLAAVIDPGFTRHHDLEMSSDAKYFNSGVMLLNLERWRRDHVKETVIGFIRRKPAAVVFPDQCGINSAVNGRWKELHPRFNLQRTFFHKQTFLYSRTSEALGLFPNGELVAANEDPIIVHYSGVEKPWHISYSLPDRDLYWKYLRKTPYSHLFSEDFTILKAMRWWVPRLRVPRLIKKGVKNLYHRTFLTFFPVRKLAAEILEPHSEP
jgi:lipopolysaccharide biosynthesis glycosyltransferase